MTTENVKWENINVVEPEPKDTISIRLDRDILNFFKSEGMGYQAKINSVLRGYTEHKKEEMKRKGIHLDRVSVVGGKVLRGSIDINGAKNAALPIMIASMLCDEEIVLKNVPNLKDIDTTCKLLLQHGVIIHRNQSAHTLKIHTPKVTNVEAPYDIVKQMRASIYVLAPLLARMNKAKVSFPGGCAIGARPIDLHLKSLEKMGVKIEIKEGYIYAEAPNGLQGATLDLKVREQHGVIITSVGATIQMVNAAVLAKGTTTIKNVAKEPHVKDVCDFLNSMGAKIKGAGTDTIVIEGVTKLHKAEHTIISDQIEAGTYAIAAAITKGKITLNKIDPEIIKIFLDKLKKAGVNIKTKKDSVTIDATKGNLKSVDIETAPHPGFPTDLQAQFMAFMMFVKGTAKITENIFENRFLHAVELQRMGAKIEIDNQGNAFVKGGQRISGANVMASDLRASSALILAGLAAKGETTVHRVYHLDRGFEGLEEKLRKCGAQIRRVTS